MRRSYPYQRRCRISGVGAEENAGCRSGSCVCPFLFCHVMIAPEGAPTGVVEDTRCRSGFSRDVGAGLVPALFFLVT